MIELSGLSDDELIGLYGSIMAALLDRGIVHSGNNPIADIAERLVADHYGVEPEPPNQKAYDVVAKDRTRIQVKALRKTKKGRTRLSAFHSLDFELLAIVIFQPDLQLDEVALVPVDVVEEFAGWSKSWNAHSLSVTNKLMSDTRVEHLAKADLGIR